MKIFAMILGVTVGLFAAAEGTSNKINNPAVTQTMGPKLLGGGGLVDRSMNPAVSVNALFMGAWGQGILSGREKGLQIQEIEASFTASVDPYFFGNVVLSVEPGTPTDMLDLVEEAFAMSMNIPRVTLKFGKMRTRFGKNNIVHSHAQPLIDRPLVVTQLLGEDGMNAIGMEASVLVPVGWYLDLTLAGYRAKDSGPFDTPHTENVAFLGRVDNLWDISDSLTTEVGATVASGENSSLKRTTVAGGDLTFKYVSSNGRGNFAVISNTELIHRWMDDGVMVNKNWGFYTSLLARLSQTWWVGGRLDYLKDFGPFKSAENLVLAYVPSEFSAIRLQGGMAQPSDGSKAVYQTLLQYNMTIGSHPAHAY